jgi:hypothetical protein
MLLSNQHFGSFIVMLQLAATKKEEIIMVIIKIKKITLMMIRMTM